jgi:glycosyltransferase involved in cell wall biosynthesis
MINLIAPINPLGYGVVGLNVTKALDSQTDVSLWPVSQPQVSTQEDADLIQRTIANAQKPDWLAPCIRIWHQNDMSQFVGRGDKIGFPIFELDKFNHIETHHLSSLDKIFVCSEWAAQVIRDQIGPDQVHVIPLGVNSDIFSPKPLDNQEKDGTIFFNCGKWEFRKGHDVIARAFNKAFSPEDNVKLWMMCDNPFCSEAETVEWESLYRYSDLSDKIQIISRVETSQEVYNIMSKVDCGLFPSRAEGWNLEALELLSCGKHLIITDYSGHTEFCTKENSRLVTIKEKEMAYDGKWFDGKTGMWAKIGNSEIDQIVEHMREIHRLKSEGSLGLNEEGIKTAKRFSWANTAKKMIDNV